MSAADLTGPWTGIFNYPDRSPPNGFEAVLRDSGGVLVGETSEASDHAGDQASVLHAWIEGRHDGDRVRFVKSYDVANRAGDPVSYDGTVSGDGTEIEGVWDIHGYWSGTFLMVRHAGRAAAVERETVAVR